MFRLHSRRRRTVNRRGMILLVILGMLGLFMLITVSYVMTMGAERRGARIIARSGQTGMPPEALLKMAMYQLVRGPSNPSSAIGPHSLLEDLYGDKETVVGMINPSSLVDRPGNQQFIQLAGLINFGADRKPGTAGVDDDGNGEVDDAGEAMSGDDLLLENNPQGRNGPPKVEGYYAGRVITMLDGPAANQSARIVRWYKNTFPAEWRMLIRPFPNGAVPQPGNQFVINGRAYNGAGMDIPPPPGTTTTTTQPLLAKLPNPPNPASSDPPDQDEGYDAPDWMNPFLAARLYNTSTGQWQVVLPSFHRPDLMQYYVSSYGNYTSIPTNIKQRIALRPDPSDNVSPDYSDNPNLYYWNPSTNPTPWDVDNDQDGQMDSVWIDLGAPLQTTPDGRLVKPLFAILCVDLDGRINLNAHGNSSSYEPAMPSQYTLAGLLQQKYNADSKVYTLGPERLSTARGGPYAGSYNQANPSSSYGWIGKRADVSLSNTGPSNAIDYVGIGMGFGPAEINLVPLLGMAVTSTTSPFIGTSNPAQQLVEGKYQNVSRPIMGRYGEVHLLPPSGSVLSSLPSYPSWGQSFPRAGLTARGTASTANGWLPIDPRTGDDNWPPAVEAAVRYDKVDAASISGGLNAFHYRGNANTSPAYASPSDMKGTCVLGIDFRGMPFYGHLDTRRVMIRSSASPNSSRYLTPVVWQDLIDDPYEINLFEDAQRKTFDYYKDGYPGDLPGQANSSDDRKQNVVDIDAPLTPYELEQILRSHDRDQVYDESTRVKQLLDLGYAIDIASLRHRVTTESWDVPVPAFHPTPEIWDGIRTVKNASGDVTMSGTDLVITDLLLGKIYEVNKLAGNSLPSGYTPNQWWNWANDVVEKMAAFDSTAGITTWSRTISPDLLLGMRMDLNRPFGNNRDDNFDGNSSPNVNSPRRYVADEPGEGSVQPLWGDMSDTSLRVGSGLDLNWDGVPNNDEWPRQEYAKQLYLLMMMLMDSSYKRPLIQPGTYTTREQQVITAYRVAQWAVNVVDFRDADAIMTPFEFDIFPFEENDPSHTDISTWDVDGKVGQGSPIYPVPSNGPFEGVVWGMEYPELLITETFATHDKRLADTNKAASSSSQPPSTTDKKTTDSGTPADPDWDQVRLPQGSLFIELYCTGRARSIPDLSNNGSDPTGAVPPADPRLEYLPPELYNTTQPVEGGGIGSTTGNPLTEKYGALDLGRLSLGGQGKRPVWRLAISAPHMGTDGGVSPYNRPSVSEMLYNPLAGTNYRPDTLTMQPESMDLFGNTTYNVPIERIVWFANLDPSDSRLSNRREVYHGWWTPSSGSAVDNVENQDPRLLLVPGQYAVIGPARPVSSNQWAPGTAGLNVTRFGYTDNNLLKWQPPKIDLETQAFSGTTYPLSVDLNGNTLTPNNSTTKFVQRPLGIPIGKVIPNIPNQGGTTQPLAQTYSGYRGGSSTGQMQGLNISEPLYGYTNPSNAYAANRAVTDPYGGWSTMDGYLTPVTRSLDWAPAITKSGAITPNPPTLGSLRMLQPGTYQDFRTVFLQRLANPLAEWNPMPNDTASQSEYEELFGSGTWNSKHVTDPINPYITVDWMPIDLTIFNGETVYTYAGNPSASPAIPGDTPSPQDIQKGEAPPASGATVTSWPSAANSPSAPVNYWRYSAGSATTANFLRFDTRERGPRVPETSRSDNTVINPFPTEYNNPSGWPNTEVPLWSAISDSPRVNSRETVAASEFGFTFKHHLPGTLGYLNRHYGLPLSSTSIANVKDLEDASLKAEYVGSPEKAFPWLTWNNRPFANAMELLVVPACSPGRFGIEFTYKTAASSAPSNFYADGAAQLWGKWDTTSSPTNNPARHAKYTPPEANFPFGHMLNFFASSDTYVDPDPNRAPRTPSSNYFRIFDFVHVPSRFSGTEEIIINPSIHPFLAPFNRVPKFREPGRINLNTMFDAEPTNRGDLTTLPPMWAALTNYFPPLAPTASNNAGARDSWTNFLKQRGDVTPSGGNNGNYGLVQNTNLPAAFARPLKSFSGGYLPTANAKLAQDTSGNPLLEADFGLLRRDWIAGASEPLFGVRGYPTGTATDYRDFNRNPYFKYQQFMKLGGSTTHRSNVYAAWITMGLFEVQPTAVSATHPDGYALIREWNRDTGNMERHRAFCIINRSIPVGFLRGEDLNIDKVFLIKHFIQ